MTLDDHLDCIFDSLDGDFVSEPQKEALVEVVKPIGDCVGKDTLDGRQPEWRLHALRRLNEINASGPSTRGQVFDGGPLEQFLDS